MNFPVSLNTLPGSNKGTHLGAGEDFGINETQMVVKPVKIINLFLEAGSG